MNKQTGLFPQWRFFGLATNGKSQFLSRLRALQNTHQKLVERIIKKINNAAWTLKRPAVIFLCIFRTLPWPEFCSGWKLISEGTVFKTVIYLLHICIVFHIWSVFVFIYTGKRKEKSPPVFTVGEGSENRPFSYKKCTFKSPEPSITGLQDGPFFVSVIYINTVKCWALGPNRLCWLCLEGRDFPSV